MFVTGLVSGALIAAAVLGLGWTAHSERQARRAIERELGELKKRLANLERVDKNPLYRDAIEDQRARQLRAADDAATGIAFMEQAIRTLRGKGNDKP